MNNEPYYGVIRTDEYLAHYGIKGMKWGVRKARESGDARALGRQYRKAQKKLAKLEARAANGKKYARRAALMGAGAAAAGGLAAVGTGGVAQGIARGGHMLGRAAKGVGTGMRRGGNALANLGARTHNAALAKTGIALSTAGRSIRMPANTFVRNAGQAGVAVSKWGKATGISDAITGKAALMKKGSDLISQGGSKALRSTAKGAMKRTAGFNALEKAQGIRSISNNTIARIGAGAVGAGLAGGAAYNAYRAATTKRAAQKAAQFRNEMNKAFAGTQYDHRRKKNRRG